MEENIIGKTVNGFLNKLLIKLILGLLMPRMFIRFKYMVVTKATQRLKPFYTQWQVLLRLIQVVRVHGKLDHLILPLLQLFIAQPIILRAGLLTVSHLVLKQMLIF